MVLLSNVNSRQLYQYLLPDSSLLISAFPVYWLEVRVVAMRFAAFAIVCGVIGFTGSHALAQTICPSTAIANGNAVDATLVTSWFSCKAPTDNPIFTGSVGIGTTAPSFPVEIYGGGNLKLAIHNSGSSGHAWTFNSAANGSLYIGDDTAAANRLVIDTSGNVLATSSLWVAGAIGVGTSTPSQALEVAGNVGNLKLAITNTNSTGHSWTFNSSVSGNLYIGDDTVPANRVVIDTSGHVGINTLTAAQALEVNGMIQVDSLAAASSTPLCINANVISSCSSSLRYKEDVQSAAFGLTEVMAMRPVTFKWKGRDENDLGLIAEEVAKINPLFVTYKNGKIEGVKYPQLVAVLVGAVKEQQAQIAQQDADIHELKQQVAYLRSHVRVQTVQK